LLVFESKVDAIRQEEGKHMIRLENISKYYHSGNNIVLALRKINLDMNIGEFIVITGESGSGKSTLLNVLSGLDTYEEGKLFINNKNVSHYSVRELEHYRKDYIGFIFQDYNIINSYSVYQNVALALTVQGLSKEEKHQKTIEIIKQVGLEKQMHQKAVKLSGGEKQRTVIARTLAKNSRILVCDEPTGNLDKESGNQILELLHTLSKDKLVIVVTHDFESIEAYATRKIRLYDGEILEDNVISKANIKTEEIFEQKRYFTSFIDMIKISFTNVISVPRKTIFMLLILMFMTLVTLFTYGNGIAEQNRPYTYATPYFSNPDQSRIIVTKTDQTMFDNTEMEEIKEIEYVRTVFENDTVFNTILVNRAIDPIYSLEKFYYFRILSSEALNEFDLIEGELPKNHLEVVISDRTFYEIGDYIEVSDSYIVRELSGSPTDQWAFKVVGITSHNVRLESDMHTMYFTDEALGEISLASIYSRSESYLEITGTTLYHTPTDTWITPEMNSSVFIDTIETSLINNIKIDNGLLDYQIKTFDRMFYDICRDLGYKKEIVDDMDAGLCDTAPFIDTHSFQLSAITTFENKQNYVDIDFISYSFIENNYDQNLYMNRTTFLEFFGEKNYQIAVIVYDVYEGKQVVEDLEEMGYNVFYPSQLINTEDAIDILLTNIRILLVIVLTLAGVYMVGFIVLKNIIMSKQKDYLIYRSIGTSTKTVRRIIQLEVAYIFALSAVLVITLVYILEQYKTPIPPILRYIQWNDYLLLFFMILIVLLLMIRAFGKKVFDVNIISTLKGIES